MAADLGLVAHAAEGDPHELAAQGAGDRLAERRLADAREDRPGPGSRPRSRRPVPTSSMPALGPQLAHGQVLDDALLHLVEAGVVGVEDGAGLGRRRGGPRSACPTAARARCRATCGSSRAPGSARWCARACRSRARPRRATASGSCAASASLVAVARRRRPRRRRRRPAPCGWRPAGWRSRNSRWVFSMPSATSVRICSASSQLGQGLLGPAQHLGRRAPRRRRSRAARPCARPTGRASSRDGSARAPGSVVLGQRVGHPPAAAALGAAPRRRRRSSRASSRGAVGRRCPRRPARPRPTARGRRCRLTPVPQDGPVEAAQDRGPGCRRAARRRSRRWATVPTLA